MVVQTYLPEDGHPSQY